MIKATFFRHRKNMGTSREIFTEFLKDIVNSIFGHHDAAFTESIKILCFDSYERKRTGAT